MLLNRPPYPVPHIATPTFTALNAACIAIGTLRRLVRSNAAPQASPSTPTCTAAYQGDALSLGPIACTVPNTAALTISEIHTCPVIRKIPLCKNPRYTVSSTIGAPITADAISTHVHGLPLFSTIIRSNGCATRSTGSPDVLYTLHTPPKAIGEVADAVRAGQLLPSTQCSLSPDCPAALLAIVTSPSATAIPARYAIPCTIAIDRRLSGL